MESSGSAHSSKMVTKNIGQKASLGCVQDQTLPFFWRECYKTSPLPSQSSHDCQHMAPHQEASALHPRQEATSRHSIDATEYVTRTLQQRVGYSGSGSSNSSHSNTNIRAVAEVAAVAAAIAQALTAQVPVAVAAHSTDLEGTSTSKTIQFSHR